METEIVVAMISDKWKRIYGNNFWYQFPPSPGC